MRPLSAEGTVGKGGLGYRAANTESRESRLLFYAFRPMEHGPNRNLGEPEYDHDAFRRHHHGLCGPGPPCHRVRRRLQDSQI